MNKPTPRTLIIAPILAIGVVFVASQAANAAFGIFHDQRLVDAKDTMQELVHASASEVASSTESEPQAVRAKPKALQGEPSVMGSSARKRQSARRMAARAERNSDTLPTRYHRGQRIPDFSRMQGEGAESARSSGARRGRYSGRRPMR
ncbi:MAG: hypothetical protein CL927_08805 [Deltaproteobacteria bacterium]|nr:hypothetical protein [Deltaproteobacteria bacterium]HCH63928.1 hypothetical protein [Deltaproteobacteria bacterium]